mmetsp:Transcript_39160/g.124485  ORF Transcript_39160/g.124485 Transcript_39160/m.124485 type:complete len:326 (-) Transcript_39160:149-1126(-)
MSAMASQLSARAALRIGMSSDISGLRRAVEAAFAASPLAAHHTLELLDLPSGTGELPQTEILLADPGKARTLLDSLQGLRWMQSTWAGVNALECVHRRDFTCTRLAGCFGQQMSEYVFGAVLCENWQELGKYQVKREWTPEPFKKRRRFNSMVMGFLGVGDISTVIAGRARAFGMQTVGFATWQRECEGFDSMSTDLDTVLGMADIIVSVLPSTKQTRGLLNGGKLEACGAGKLFINVGRGDVVSEESLLQALERGWLRRAVLDVFAVEPLPHSSPLWSHPAVHVTPHIAAVSYADDVASLFVENLGLWLEGKPLRFTVALDKGY